MCSVLGLIPCFQISSQRPYPLDYLHPLKQTSTTSVTKKISSKRESAVKYLDQFWRENLGWKVFLSGFEFKKLLLSNCLECKTTLSDTVVSNGLMVIFGSFSLRILGFDSRFGKRFFFVFYKRWGKKKNDFTPQPHCDKTSESTELPPLSKLQWHSYEFGRNMLK